MKLACGRCWDRDCKCTAQELKEWNSVKEKTYSISDIESYCEKYPNDTELGREIRKLRYRQ